MKRVFNKKYFALIISGVFLLLAFYLAFFSTNRNVAIKKGSVNKSSNTAVENNVKNNINDNKTSNNSNNSTEESSEKSSEEKKEDSYNKEESKTTTTNDSTTSNNTVAQSMHDINQSLIQNIYSTYGYVVNYGDYGYTPDGEYCAAATDEDAVHEALLTIQNASAKFPSGFFRTFQGVNGYSVYLFGSIPYGTAGIASYNDGDNSLYLNVSYYDEMVYYHETFHIMERYINKRGGGFDINTWNSYNPPNYIYGNDALFYYKGDYNPNDSFLYQYGTTNEREDRATLFADLMFRAGVCYYGSYKDYMTSGTKINLKFHYLTSIINNYFPNNNARWNFCVR